MFPFLFIFSTLKIVSEILSNSHYDYRYFSYISSGFCFIYIYFFVVRCTGVHNVYLLCELYLFSLKVVIFVAFNFLPWGLSDVSVN